MQDNVLYTLYHSVALCVGTIRGQSNCKRRITPRVCTVIATCCFVLFQVGNTVPKSPSHLNLNYLVEDNKDTINGQYNKMSFTFVLTEAEYV